MTRAASAGLEQLYADGLAALRAGRWATAERHARALQAAVPGEPKSLRLLGAALLAQDEVGAAVDVLQRAVTAAPDFAPARIDLARAWRQDGRLPEAREQLRQVLAQLPRSATAWLAYGDVLVDLKHYAEARVAYERARLSDGHVRRIDAARELLAQLDRKGAEEIFRSILQVDASHVGALCGLAAVSLVAGMPQDAERLLRHAGRQTAHLPLVWRGLGQALLDLGRLPESEAAIRHLLQIEPENPKNWIVLGTVCTRLMRQEDALVAYREAARLNPTEVRLQLSIGHLQKTLGRRAESEAAYRECLRLDPAFTEAYWSLADLKNYQFSDAEVAAMQALDRGPDAVGDDQAQLHFALGRAFEQRAAYATAFAHYATGNAQRRRDVPYSSAKFDDKSRRVREVFDAAFFASRGGSGEPDPAPIFVVGLPRSGSTLVEQILASHPQVEGTFELPNVLTIVREFDHADANHDAYPERVLTAPTPLFAVLGRRYLEETAPLRHGRPRFIDKMPNNFSHVGLIHAMLPRATIIDIRRHPMDACFSTFKQYFAEGQSFSYGLDDLGRYYRCYLSLMDHWDQVLPGRVLHVSYEDLVRDPEANIRRLLAHCGLPFEPACLSFHQTRRPVRTASAEQVRQPLYTSGVGYWRHFESQLEPLRQSLGDCLDRF